MIPGLSAAQSQAQTSLNVLFLIQKSISPFFLGGGGECVPMFLNHICCLSTLTLAGESYTVTAQHNICAGLGVGGAHGQASMRVDVIRGFRTPPPSHFHYGQISGLCYGGVAFCRRAGSLITHTALLHFHFLFIQPPFHSGFIILPSELSGLPECLQPVEMT